MKKSIAIALFALLTLGTATTLPAAIVGDIDNDGIISLQEAIYALQVTSGVVDLPDSCAITGRGDWATATPPFRLCDVVKYNEQYYICSPQEGLTTCGIEVVPSANDLEWKPMSLTGANGLNSAISITPEAPGANCADGGQKIQAGLDTDDDGFPDTGLNDPTYVCNGATGTSGTIGIDGLACWDIDEDRVCDAEEDIDGSSTCDASDCRGIQGESGLACWDLDGDRLCDAEEDIDGNTACDVSDCKGTQGEPGASTTVTVVTDNYLADTQAYCEFGGTTIEVRVDGELTDISSNCNATPPATVTNSFGMTFNLIPAGTFQMGMNPDSVVNYFSDEVPHPVTITQPFFMQTTEVTQEQYLAVMDPGGDFIDNPNNPSSHDHCPTCPVEFVSWADVQVFIQTINSMGSETYRLPTEAEWEYAARAGTTSDFYLGPISSATEDPIFNLIGWYSYNSDPDGAGAELKQTHPVGQKLPNAWGLYDMLGNVMEWVQDWYQADLGTALVIDDPQNPGPATGTSKVLRGGSYTWFAQHCRAPFRLFSGSYGNPDTSYRGDIGFRLVVQK